MTTIALTLAAAAALAGMAAVLAAGKAADERRIPVRVRVERPQGPRRDNR